MNRKLLITLGLLVAVLACNKDKSEVVPASDGSANGAPTEATTRSSSVASRNSTVEGPEPTTHPTYYTGRTIGEGSSSASLTSTFITKEVANEMINSYLYSMNHDHDYDEGAPAINSYSIDADSLRVYLEDSHVKHIKVMFGHTMDYISAGYYGQYSGFRTGALTLIIVGYDAAGNYVYLRGKVLDHVNPCPYSCPSGTAGSPILE